MMLDALPDELLHIIVEFAYGIPQAFWWMSRIPRSKRAAADEGIMRLTSVISSKFAGTKKYVININADVNYLYTSAIRRTRVVMYKHGESTVITENIYWDGILYKDGNHVTITDFITMYNGKFYGTCGFGLYD